MILIKSYIVTNAAASQPGVTQAELDAALEVSYTNEVLVEPDYNSYVTAWLDRATALDYTLTSDIVSRALSNFFFTVGSTIISKVDALYFFVLNNASLQNIASLNLISPSDNQATYLLSPVYGTNGVKPNGVDSYISTNFNPVTEAGNYSLNSACRFMYIMTDTTVGGRIDGNTAGSATNFLSPSSSTSQRINSSNNLNTAVNMGGTGYRAINRSDANNVQLYTGLTKFDRTQASGSLVSSSQVLGRNATTYGNPEFGMYGMGGSLTEAEHNAIASAFGDYLTDIGL